MNEVQQLETYVAGDFLTTPENESYYCAVFNHAEDYSYKSLGRFPQNHFNRNKTDILTQPFLFLKV